MRKGCWTVGRAAVELGSWAVQQGSWAVELGKELLSPGVVDYRPLFQFQKRRGGWF